MSEDKRTATQKIDDLEKVVTILYQAATQTQNTVQGLAKLGNDMALVRDALKLLNKKTEAIIQVATPETGITVESVTALVVKMNVEDLKAQVTGYLANGHLIPGDTVAADSYIVCEESNSDGTLANPRIQFRLDSQDEATAAALTGKKAGDTVYIKQFANTRCRYKFKILVCRRVGATLLVPVTCHPHEHDHYSTKQYKQVWP